MRRNRQFSSVLVQLHPEQPEYPRNSGTVSTLLFSIRIPLLIALQIPEPGSEIALNGIFEIN